MKTSLLVLLLALLSGAVSSKDTDLDKLPERQELLNGKTLVFEYTNGWGFSLSFYDNMIKYQYRRDVTGKSTDVGARNQDIPYRSRLIGEDQYLIFWHEPGIKDTVSMVINLQNNTLYASGLLGYDKEEVYETFLAAHIMQILDDS